MIKSWKTTLAGALAALGAFFLTQDFAGAQFIGAILAAAGPFFTGLFARDNDVSSEDAGAA